MIQSTTNNDKVFDELTNKIRLDFRKRNKVKRQSLTDVKAYFVEAYYSNSYIRENYSYSEFFDKVITINGLTENHKYFMYGDTRYVNSFHEHPSMFYLEQVSKDEDTL